MMLTVSMLSHVIGDFEPSPLGLDTFSRSKIKSMCLRNAEETALPLKRASPIARIKSKADATESEKVWAASFTLIRLLFKSK